MKVWVSIPNSEVRQNYSATFSLNKWKYNSLSVQEKGTHSLSNCHACASNFDSIQRTFPLKPYFQPTTLLTEASFIENEYPKFNEKCKKLIGKSFPEIAANNAKKLGLRYINGEVQKAIKDTKRKCTAECNASLEKSTLRAAYATDLSFSRLQKYSKAQYYEPPNESSKKKKRYSLQSHQCNRYDELVDKLRNWDESTPFVATHLAKDFEVVGTDASHKLKLLALELNPTIPGLEIKPKRKSIRKKFEGTSISMPVPPNKRKLKEIDASLVESGHLNIGIPCVPVEIQRQFKGKVKVIQAHSRKFSFVDIRKCLLDKHQHLMRLHSNDEIGTMTRERILELLNMVDGSEHTNYSTDELREILTHNERSRSLWVWHDHSSLVSHGIIAVMIGIMYDPIVFLSESKSPGIQEFVEEGEIHFVAHGTSSLSDQLAIVPERVAELEGLSEKWKVRCIERCSMWCSESTLSFVVHP